MTIDTEVLCSQVKQAYETKTLLLIKAGNSKSFYGRAVDAKPLSLKEHSGIIEYEPSELVITARAGTPLAEINKRLDEQHQILAFEPPAFTDQATIGGAIACGLSGPRRPFTGAARDFVLGVGIINGKGEALKFGGKVMKNVAGYDLSRLLTGSLGTLGVILDVSLKVLPKPEVEYTLTQDCSQPQALQIFSSLAGASLPLSAASWFEGQAYIRLSGSELGTQHACESLSDFSIAALPDWWNSIRDQQHEFFSTDKPLWRLSVPPATPELPLEGNTLIDWAGGQRWICSDDEANHIRKIVDAVGGHATLFRNGDRQSEIFHPLPTAMLNLQKRIKLSMDPHGIFNPGRMYKEL